MDNEINVKMLSEKKSENVKLDLKDLKLIAALSVNTRLTPSYLGKLIGVSKDTIRYRINRLKEKGVLLHSGLIVNPYSLGFQFRTLFLKINNLKPEKEMELAKFVVEHPFIVWGGIVGGEWDFGIHLLTKDRKHFNHILKEVKLLVGDNLIELSHLDNYEITQYENVPPVLKMMTGVKVENMKKDISFQSYLDKEPVSDSEGEVILDRLDKDILIRLSENPDVSVADLSYELKKSFDTIKDRMIRMIKEDVIIAFNPILNLTRTGFSAYIIFLETRDIEEETKIRKIIRGHPNVGYALRSYGKWDWHLYLAVKDQFEFYSVLRSLRSSIGDNLRNYSSLAVIQDFKFTFTPAGLIEYLKR